MEWINPNETERIAERDLEVRKVAEDAWRRLGALYLKTATGHAHWALRESGRQKMPVKARRSKHRKHRITQEAVEAFEAGDFKRLHNALGLAPWQPSPLDVDPDGESPHPPGTGGHDGWPLACELQRELLEAGAKMPTRRKERDD